MHSVKRLSYAVVALASTAALGLVAAPPAAAAPGDRVTLLTGGGVLDGRPAEQAAVDAVGAAQLANGDLLVADAHRRIRLVDGTTGLVSTVAGTSARTTGADAADLAANGDGGPATDAEVTDPRWVDRRDDGTVVLVDGRRVRAIDPATHVITTIAGTGAAGPAADGPVATDIALDPTAFALDRASGDVYLGDRATATVRVVRADGSTATLVGGGTTTGVVEAPATDLRIAAPTGLALMPDGSLLVREGRYLWQVSGGQATLVSGTANRWARAPRDGAAVAGAALPTSGAGDLAVSPDGTVFLADSAARWGRRNAVVRQFTLDGTITFRRGLPCPTVTSGADDGTMLLACGELWRVTGTELTRLAGGSSGRGTLDTAPDGTPGREAAWSRVVSPVSDGLGRAWFGTGRGATVVRYDDADGRVHHVAGTGIPGTGARTDGAPAVESDLGSTVDSLALLPGGRLAVATDRRVSIVEPDGTLTFLTDGSGRTYRYTDGMAAAEVATFGPVALAATPAGDLLLSTAGTVLEVRLSDRTVRVRGGDPFARSGGNGLAATQTRLGWIRELAPFGAGEVAVLTGSRHGDRAIRGLQADGRVGTLAQGTLGSIAPTADGGLLVVRSGVSAADPRALVKIAADRSVAVLGTGGATLADDVALGDASLDGVRLGAEPGGVLLAAAGRLRRAAIADTAAAATIPAAPTGLTAVPAPDGRSLRVDWTAPAGTPDRIAVHVDATGTAAPSGLAPMRATLAAGATGYTVTGLTPGARVTVSAFATSGEFARSVPATATVVMPGDTTAPRLYGVRIGSGKTIPVSWSTPTGSDLADVVVLTRTDRLPADPADGTVAYTGLTGPVTLDAPARPDSLYVGVFVRDWSGNVSRAAAREVRPALPPAPVVTSPTASVTRDTEITVAWRTVTDPWGGTPTYQIRERMAPSTGLFGAWSEPQPATGTTLTLPAENGQTYCVEVRAVGEDGATGPWSATRCTTVPLDDTALVAGANWTTTTAAGLYGGSASRSATRGATLTADGVYGSRIALVASTCPSCGTVGVYVDDRLVRSVGLYARRATTQSVSVLPARTMNGSTVTLKVTSSGRPVTVDGIAFLR